MSKRIFFETESIYAQDGDVGEYEVGKSREFALDGFPQESFKELEYGVESYKHVKDSTYEIVGRVYRTYNIFAFMNLGDFNIVICDGRKQRAKGLKEGALYSCVVDFVYDPWDCYHLEMRNRFHKPIGLSGEVKSILLDSSVYVVEAGPNQERAKDAVPRRFDIPLQKTSCWEDSSPGIYLIEVEIQT